MSSIRSLYTREHARLRNSPHMYPSEWVVRSMLGRYPELRLEPVDWRGKSVLDLGFGDGRNFPLLHNLGVDILGVEISEEICAEVRERAGKRGIGCELREGTNTAIPFPDHSVDHVLACHSCYYVEPGSSFERNIEEIARVVRDLFIFSAPTLENFIFDRAERLPQNHFVITNDPYGLRNGSVMRGFGSRQEIEEALRPYFVLLGCGRCVDNWYGIHQDSWIAVARRQPHRSAAA